MVGKRSAKRTAMFAALGAIPGLLLLLLTIPVSGEVELTLGVGGLLLTVVGVLIGAAVGAQRRV